MMKIKRLQKTKLVEVRLEFTNSFSQVSSGPFTRILSRGSFGTTLAAARQRVRAAGN